MIDTEALALIEAWQASPLDTDAQLRAINYLRRACNGTGRGTCEQRIDAAAGAAGAVFTYLTRHPTPIDKATLAKIQPIADQANRTIAARIKAGIHTWSGWPAVSAIRDVADLVQSLAVRLTLDTTPEDHAELAILAQLPARLLRAVSMVVAETIATLEVAGDRQGARALAHIASITLNPRIATAAEALATNAGRVVEVMSLRSFDPEALDHGGSQMRASIAQACSALALCHLFTLELPPDSNPDADAQVFEVDSALHDLDTTLMLLSK